MVDMSHAGVSARGRRFMGPKWAMGAVLSRAPVAVDCRRGARGAARFVVSRRADWFTDPDRGARRQWTHGEPGGRVPR